VIDEPFSEQNHLLNSTMKMVRGRIAERHRDRLDSLFTPGGRQLASAANLQAIGRLIG